MSRDGSFNPHIFGNSQRTCFAMKKDHHALSELAVLRLKEYTVSILILSCKIDRRAPSQDLHTKWLKWFREISSPDLTRLKGFFMARFTTMSKHETTRLRRRHQKWDARDSWPNLWVKHQLRNLLPQQSYNPMLLSHRASLVSLDAPDFRNINGCGFDVWITALIQPAAAGGVCKKCRQNAEPTHMETYL